MTPFDELTPAAKALLTDEQVERYIELRCAEAGVKPWVGAPPAPPTEKNPTSETRVYVVCGLFFLSEAEAERVADALMQATPYDLTHANGRWSGPRVLRPVPPGDARLRLHTQYEPTERDFAAQQYAAQRYASLEANYAEQRERFNRWFEQRNEIAEQVHADIREAKAMLRKQERVRATYQHYLDLAESNLATARRFLLAAYADAEELCPELFDDAVPPPPARALRLREAVDAGQAAAGTDSDIPF